MAVRPRQNHPQLVQGIGVIGVGFKDLTVEDFGFLKAALVLTGKGIVEQRFRFRRRRGG